MLQMRILFSKLLLNLTNYSFVTSNQVVNKNKQTMIQVTNQENMINVLSNIYASFCF